jgi:hypothetical protein
MNETVHIRPLRESHAKTQWQQGLGTRRTCRRVRITDHQHSLPLPRSLQPSITGRGARGLQFPVRRGYPLLIHTRSKSERRQEESQEPEAMSLSHGRQDKQHPNHRNKISFQRAGTEGRRVVLPGSRYYQLPRLSPPTHFRKERSSRTIQPDRSA